MKYGAKSNATVPEHSRPLYNEPPMPMWRVLAGWIVAGLVLVLLVVFSGGCSSKAVQNVEETAARGVNTYCASFPYEVRSTVIKPRFAAAVAPHKVTVDCYGDPNNPRPAASGTTQ